MSDITRKFNISGNKIALGVFLLLIGSVLAATNNDQQSTKSIVKKDVRKNDEFPEEDSDMLMEPNDFTPITVLRSHEQHYHSPPVLQHQHQPQQQQQFRQFSIPHNNARADIVHADSHTQAAQNFFPNFFRDALAPPQAAVPPPPLGHSRPYFAQPHGETQPPLIGKYIEQHGSAAAGGPPPAIQRGFDTSVLGSGDFGVLRGGTFYPEEEMPYHPEENSDFNQYYGGDIANGHGRPSNEGFIEKYTYPEEQFAHFRDFADINTPTDSAFSQYVVVYAAKNATNSSTNHPRPKNIFEQLQLLDQEKALEDKKAPRASKTKTKLAKSKVQKKLHQKKKPSPKDWDYEPLLALS